MKKFAVLLLLLTSAPFLRAEPPSPVFPGLLVQEFARHEQQSDDRRQFQIDIEDLKHPVGQPAVAADLNPWRWTTERNALAKGLLEVPEDGDYAFTTRSFYDRNFLTVDGKRVCGFRDGEDHAGSLPLKKGRVSIVSFGAAESRGKTEGIRILWKPPGQAEFSPIPPALLKHEDSELSRLARRTVPALRATRLITVANDYIVDVYRNGVKVPDAKRKLLEEHHGATAEQIDLEVRPGDCLVFQVVHNRLRWGGSRYFAVAGLLPNGEYGFVSDPASPDWSMCDDAGQSLTFIRRREFGTQKRPNVISNPWDQGDGYMRKHAGAGYLGKPVWGSSSVTWIKYLAPKEDPAVKASPEAEKQPAPSRPVADQGQPPAKSIQPAEGIVTPARWPVQILSAIYGTGGKNADVTAAVKGHVEVKKRMFAVTPPDLGQDPNPYWNKALHIVYMKDGVRREQHRGENEHVLPQSFYGPQDAGELRAWLLGTRWRGEGGDIQFHANGTLTGPGLEGAPLWETLEAGKLRITWSAERKTEYGFDYVWESFRDGGNAKDSFHLVR